MDRALLLTIIDKFAGGPVGVDTLAAAIGEERDTIEDVYEPFLIQEGFLARTPKGRVGDGARLRALRAAGRARRRRAAEAPLTARSRRADAHPAGGERRTTARQV